jgi:hypothetical protein
LSRQCTRLHVATKDAFVPLVVFIDRKMQFSPGSTSGNLVFILVPFVFAVDLQASGINDD